MTDGCYGPWAGSTKEGSCVMAGKFELCRDKAGKFPFRLKANGQIHPNATGAKIDGQT